MAAPKVNGLRDKHRKFAEEYVIDLNAKQAAIRAGYSPKTAEVQGCQLLSNPKVAAYVAELKQKRSEETKIDAAWVLREAVNTYKAATADNAHTAATSALKLVGQHTDIRALVDSKEVKHSGEVSLSSAERQIRAQHLLKTVAERKGGGE